MKKKMLIFTLILALIIIFISVTLYRSPATADDIFKGYNKQEISSILISQVNGEFKELSEDEINYFISLIEETEFKQKLIPNVKKFDTDAVIDIHFSNSDNPLYFRFEFERQILAVEENRNKLEQFLLVDDTKLTEFIKKTLMN